MKGKEIIYYEKIKFIQLYNSCNLYIIKTIINIFNIKELFERYAK